MLKPTCSIPECDRAAKSRGWCASHYMRWYQTGDVGTGPIRAKDPERGCKVPGCANPHAALGYCAPHYKRVSAYGDPGPVEIRPRVIPDDEVDYVLAHVRVAASRGRASGYDCSQCGKQAREWAYDYTDPAPKIDPRHGSPYSLDVDGYAPMCASCHRRHDARQRRMKQAGARSANLAPIFSH